MAKRIDITTTQNVVIDYKAATVLERALAWLIDFISLGVSILILYLIIAAILPNQYQNTASLIIVMPLFLTYHLLCEILFGGVSLGKHALGLRVVKINNEPVSVYDYFLRWSFRLVDIAATSGIMAVITISSSPRNQRIGDFLADTTVIKISKTDRLTLSQVLGLDALKDYEPQYPEVNSLSESDMIVIKEVIDRIGHDYGPANRSLLEDTISHLEKVLDVKPASRDINFLKILIKDYVALTR